MTAKKSAADGRKAKRTRCRLKGTLRFLYQTIDINILDISRSGMALQPLGWVEAKPGSTVYIKTTEFGLVQGVVRWYRAGKMGIQIDETTNTAAQIAAYFKFFHKDASQPWERQKSIAPTAGVFL